MCLICEVTTSHNRLQESVVNTQLRKVCANIDLSFVQLLPEEV